MQKSPKVTITSRVEKDVRRKAQKAAKAVGVTLSVFVESALKAALDCIVKMPE